MAYNMSILVASCVRYVLTKKSTILMYLFSALAEKRIDNHTLTNSLRLEVIPDLGNNSWKSNLNTRSI